MAVYTSSYNTMLKRTKSESDVYIQVSRSLGHFASPDDTTGLREKLVTGDGLQKYYERALD